MDLANGARGGSYSGTAAGTVFRELSTSRKQANAPMTEVKTRSQKMRRFMEKYGRGSDVLCLVLAGIVDAFHHAVLHFRDAICE